MADPAIRVLALEDTESDARLLEASLAEASPAFDVLFALTLADAERSLRSRAYDVIIADLNVPDSDGLDTYRRLLEIAPEVPIVVLTGMGGLDLGLQALSEGAQDYLDKDQVRPDVLVRSLLFAIERGRRARDVRRLSEAHDNLLSLAAHELRGPIATIGMLAESVERGGRIPAEDAESVQAVRRQARRLYDLVGSLLDVTMVERHGAAVRRVDVGARIEHVLTQHPPPDDVTVERKVESAPFALANGVRVDEILSGLLTNAYAYGGRRVWIRAVADGKHVVVSVADDGKGVADELLPQLFEPFTRAGRPRRGDRPVGLGLHISRRFARAFGGDLTYVPPADDPDGRARFDLRLPAAVDADANRPTTTGGGVP